MRELHYTAGWVNDGCYSFRVPGPIEPPLPNSREDFELEIKSMLGSARAIEVDIQDKLIAPPWDAYRACRHHVERFHRWFPAMRDPVRDIHRHRPIPQYQSQSITSFIEAAAAVCGGRIQWLNSRIDYPEGKISMDVSREWCGTTLATNEATYIYQCWPFEPIAFNELQVGIQLELVWLSNPANWHDTHAPPVVARDPAIEARDKWLYEQCCKLVAYQTIILRLDKKSKTWLRITTVQGIKKAATTYAERQTPKLPPIPKRARGRIAGK